MSSGEKCHLLVFLNTASRQLAKFLEIDQLSDSYTYLSYEDQDAKTIVATNPFDEHKPFSLPRQYQDLYNNQHHLHQNHLCQELENRNNGFYQISATVFHIDPHLNQHEYHRNLPTLTMAPSQTQTLLSGQSQPVECYSYPIGQQNQPSLFRYNSSSWRNFFNNLLKTSNEDKSSCTYILLFSDLVP